MRHLSLFSGIGGIDLAAEWAGFTTVAFCEKDEYCQKVLKKHWPDVPIIEDVHDVNRDTISGSIELISGGFPCQPFSHAGKRRGTADDRHLWPEMLRIIQEFKPTWVLGENVVGFQHLGLDDALCDLDNIGYEAQAFDIPACGIGARHIRHRIFIVANTGSLRRDARRPQQSLQGLGAPSPACVEDTDGKRRKGSRDRWLLAPGARIGRSPEDSRFPESKVDRVANGLPGQLDRLRCLGNAVVPQQVYPILQAIADVEAV